MSKTDELLNSLPQDFFYNYDEEKADELLDEIKDDEGLWLAAPKSINSTNAETVPAVLWMKYNALRLWEVDFGSNTSVLICNLNTGQVYYRKLFPINKRYGPGTVGSRIGPKPEGLELESGAEKIHWFDLRKVCDFEIDSDNYSVTLICFDKVSNTKTFTVKGVTNKLLAKSVNVSSLGKIPDNLTMDSDGLKISQVKRNNQVFVQANFKLQNVTDKEAKILTGTLLLVGLDRGITAEQEVVVPISSKGDTVFGSFEVELDDSLSREGVLYLSINGVLSAPLPTGKEN